MEVAVRNNVKISNNRKQPMVFAHGYGCDQNMWRFVAPEFEKEYQVILFDHVGSGNSDQRAYNFEKYNTLQGYADDLIEICDNLSLKNVIFVGHSVSSMIGVLSQISRPDLFDRLVLVGPSPCYINEEGYVGGFNRQDIDELVDTLESNYLGWSSFITPVIIGNPEMPEFSEELKNSFCSMNPEIAKHFAKVTFLGDNRKDLPRVTAPTLVIQCHPDIIAPVQVGEYVHKQIPNSQYVLLDSPGHCPHLTAPDKVIRCLQPYLKSTQ
ncbi:MAG: alpha/beta hydrolase [Lunatimonas sp.]|uniref:alpha/beta fold hydrolase n=1 Tax=Lunatimonas sp. TaxID=2060141 RepID=UPI00263A3EB7|nr:alpha/beta hydrolase [Lunatimonas sp.]MCC5938273.1 alpha/beta hydrolase [Lunatimonas sp.]